MMCEEVAGAVFKDSNCYEELLIVLESKGAESRTSKPWLAYLVKLLMSMGIKMFLNKNGKTDYSLKPYKYKHHYKFMQASYMNNNKCHYFLLFRPPGLIRESNLTTDLTNGQGLNQWSSPNFNQAFSNPVQLNY